MQTESEVIPSMMIPIEAGKHAAIKKEMGADEDAEIDWDKVLNMLQLYNIYHRAYGWLSAQLFKHDEKKVKTKKP